MDGPVDDKKKMKLIRVVKGVKFYSYKYFTVIETHRRISKSYAATFSYNPS